jgi:hypothetical protein
MAQCVLEIPWFKRLWIIQEAALAEHTILKYEQIEIQLEQILEFSERVHEDIWSMGKKEASGIEAFLDICFGIHRIARQAVVLGRTPGYLAGRLMEQARYSRTSRPHNNVFAVYALLAKMDVHLPAVDYSKDVADVFMECTIALLKSDARPDLLWQIGLPRKVSGLPSWVPDWSCDKHVRYRNPSRRNKCRANRWCSIPFRSQNEGKHFQAVGVVVEKISERAEFSFMHERERLGPPHDYQKFILNEIIQDEAL